MSKELSGAKVEVKDEARAKMALPVKNLGLAAYHKAILEEQKKTVKAQPSDMVIVRDVSSEDLAKLQVEERLVGYEPKTGVALVLKEEFIDKKKAAKGK